MLWKTLFILWRLPLLSAVSSAAIALGATGQVLYPIDANIRGSEIISSFTTLYQSTAKNTTNYPYIALQTTLPNSSQYTTYKSISNGIISYVQNIASTPYNTLVLVTYLPPPASKQQSVPQYIVLPAEKMISLLYFTYATAPLSTNAFTASPIYDTIPFFSVDSTQRASDIVSAVNQLMGAPYKNTSTNSQVWVQTTLNGPFNPPLPSPGLLQNIKSVSYNNSLIQFTFQTTPQSVVQTILVAPEQVQQITYLLKYGVP